MTKIVDEGTRGKYRSLQWNVAARADLNTDAFNGQLAMVYRLYNIMY